MVIIGHHDPKHLRSENTHDNHDNWKQYHVEFNTHTTLWVGVGEASFSECETWGGCTHDQPSWDREELLWIGTTLIPSQHLCPKAMTSLLKCSIWTGVSWPHSRLKLLPQAAFRKHVSTARSTRIWRNYCKMSHLNISAVEPVELDIFPDPIPIVWMQCGDMMPWSKSSKRVIQLVSVKAYTFVSKHSAPSCNLVGVSSIPGQAHIMSYSNQWSMVGYAFQSPTHGRIYSWNGTSPLPGGPPDL